VAWEFNGTTDPLGGGARLPDSLTELQAAAVELVLCRRIVSS
jgi:hypothetical protein